MWDDPERLRKKAEPAAGDGYTLGTFDRLFETTQMVCKASLFNGDSDVLVVKASGTIADCILNGQPLNLSCAVALTMQGQEMRGPAYCNAHNTGDSYNAVIIGVR